MRKNSTVAAVFFLSIGLLCGAVKTRYGGEIRLRLNEPDTLRLSASSHSNLLFYSLLYENFFYLVPGREIESHLFRRFQYDEASMTLSLELHEGLAFSNGKPVLSRHVKNSLTAFFSRVLYRSKRLAGKVKSIVVKGDYSLNIQLTAADASIITELAAPELVLTGDEETAFSGPYLPKSWEKGRFMELVANPYYSGGRQPIERAVVFFQDVDNLDVFLAEPTFASPSYNAYPSGLYENTYITFPAAGNTGNNKRLAFYSLCRNLPGLNGYHHLESLTSAQESPLTLAIKAMPDYRIMPILRNSRQTLYLASSISVMEPALNERFRKLSIPVEIRILSDNDLSGYIEKNPVPVLIVKKLFRTETPLTEKLSALIREFSFNRFDETTLGLIKQLEEVSGFDRDELIVPAISGIMERLVEDGIILPLYQQRFQLMVRQNFKPVLIDHFSRIVWSRLRHEDNKKKP